jgi:hypothetical protein
MALRYGLRARLKLLARTRSAGKNKQILPSFGYWRHRCEVREVRGTAADRSATFLRQFLLRFRGAAETYVVVA